MENKNTTQLKKKKKGKFVAQTQSSVHFKDKK